MTIQLELSHAANHAKKKLNTNLVFFYVLIYLRDGVLVFLHHSINLQGPVKDVASFSTLTVNLLALVLSLVDVVFHLQ